MSRLPRLVSGCDLKSLPLTPADAFLLSRVDATLNEQDLALITGFSAEQVSAMLDRLAAMGAVDLGGGSQTRLRAAFATSAHPVPEPRRTPPPGDDVIALRRQAFARKLSGTQTPVTPPRRPTAPDPEDVRRTSEAIQAQCERAAEEARSAQVTEHLDQGRRALEAHDFDAAITAYRLAASIAPEDRDVQATCREALLRARGALAERHWQQAVADEREQRWEDAALGYAKVCAGRPSDGLAHERVANAALRAENVKRAVEYARKAVELAPRSGLFRITLARAYVAAGFEKSARGELARAVELAPDDPKVKLLATRVEVLVERLGRAG